MFNVVISNETTLSQLESCNHAPTLKFVISEYEVFMFVGVQMGGGRECLNV